MLKRCPTAAPRILANSGLPALYACNGGACDREVRSYRATPLPENGSTYEFNCLLLLDRLVLYPCLHIYGYRRAAADLFGDSGTCSFDCCADPLARFRVIIRSRT